MNKIKPNQFFFLFFVFIFGTNGSTCCVASIIEHSSALALVPMLITVFHGLSFTSPSVMFSGMNASVTNFHWTCETSAKTKNAAVSLSKGSFSLLLHAPPTLRHLAHLLLLSVCSLPFAERSICMHRWSYFQLLIMAASAGKMYHHMRLQQ